jgi:hypothetical protein
MVRSFLAATLVACLATFAVGCTGWNGQRTQEAQVKSVVLEGKNFRIMKSKVQASAACSYLFPSKGIAIPIAGAAIQLLPPGGIALGDPNLYEQAYRSLREQAALEGKSAQLHNVTEEVTLTDYLVIGDLKITLTADVIEFTDEYRSYATR